MRDRLGFARPPKIRTLAASHRACTRCSHMSCLHMVFGAAHVAAGEPLGEPACRRARATQIWGRPAGCGHQPDAQGAECAMRTSFQRRTDISA
eukprot:5889390-Alexandrium_andersonii.AAC.1